MKKILLINTLIFSFFISLQSHASIVDDVVKKHNLDLSDYHGDYCTLTKKIGGMIFDERHKEKGSYYLGDELYHSKNGVSIKKYLICMDSCHEPKGNNLPYCSCETANSIYLILDKNLQPIGVSPIVFDTHGKTDQYSRANNGYYKEIDTRIFNIDGEEKESGKKQNAMYAVFFSKEKPKTSDLSYIKTNGCHVEQLYIAN